MNNNMINPANYFNPFAKYNPVNKTSRGVYIPRDTEPLLMPKSDSEKSANIFSENYDAEADLNACLDMDNNESPLVWISKFFKQNEEN